MKRLKIIYQSSFLNSTLLLLALPSAVLLVSMGLDSPAPSVNNLEASIPKFFTRKGFTAVYSPNQQMVFRRDYDSSKMIGQSKGCYLPTKAVIIIPEMKCIFFILMMDMD